MIANNPYKLCHQFWWLPTSHTHSFSAAAPTFLLQEVISGLTSSSLSPSEEGWRRQKVDTMHLSWWSGEAPIIFDDSMDFCFFHKLKIKVHTHRLTRWIILCGVVKKSSLMFIILRQTFHATWSSRATLEMAWTWHHMNKTWFAWLSAMLQMIFLPKTLIYEFLVQHSASHSFNQLIPILIPIETKLTLPKVLSGSSACDALPVHAADLELRTVCAPAFAKARAC